MRLVGLLFGSLTLVSISTAAQAEFGYTASLVGVVSTPFDGYQSIFGQAQVGDTISINYSYARSWMVDHPGFPNTPFYNVNLAINGQNIDLGSPIYQWSDVRSFVGFAGPADNASIRTVGWYNNYLLTASFTGIAPEGALNDNLGNLFTNGPGTYYFDYSQPYNQGGAISLTTVSPYSNVQLDFLPKYISVFQNTDSVPEPATWLTMIMGFGAIGFGMRRKQRQTVRYDFAR